jgi:hypothetical protein
MGVYVDQITGSPVFASAFGPTVGVGLGGLTYTQNGVLADPLPVPGITGAGCSAYYLVAKFSGLPTDDSGKIIGRVQVHPTGVYPNEYVNCTPIGGPGLPSPRTLGGGASKQGAGGGGGPGSIVIPEGSPVPVKSVLSFHWYPSGTNGVYTSRVNGIPSQGPFVIPTNAPQNVVDHLMIGGATSGGANNPVNWTQSFQYYRALYYQTSAYDAAVKDALLALLP